MKIVLLRGLVREKAHWGEFVPFLKENFPESEIITPEIQGVGEYVDQITPNNFEDMIHFMRHNIADQLKDSQENILFAMSLGGMIARQWIENYPEDFQRVILVNTSFKGINPLFNRLKPLSVINFLKIFLSPSIESRERSIVKMVSNNSEHHEHIIKNWIEIQKQRPVKRKSFINQIQAALSFSPQKNWPEKIKLMILTGAKDRLCDYRSSLQLNEKWGGELHIHPEAGHDLPIDAPEWIVKNIKEWIKE